MGHNDPIFLRNKAERHNLLESLTQRLIAGIYAVENPEAVKNFILNFGRATKRNLEISDYRRLVHSPDRFFTENIHENVASDVIAKIAAYKAASPHFIASVSDGSVPSSSVPQRTTLSATSFVTFSDPVILRGQRPLWQSLIWL